MENQRIATMKQVQATFAAWKTVHDQIKELEKSVQPDSSQLKALQLESERLLLVAQHALLTIKTPRSSNGDSTWGS